MAIMKLVLENSNMVGRKIELYREHPKFITVSVISKGKFVFHDGLDKKQLEDLVHYLTTELDRMGKE